MLHFSTQGIHVRITSLVHQYSFTAPFIYGFNIITARRALWKDLRRWGTKSPWILLGDFNSILSQDDKHNREPVSNYETSDFRVCCSNLGIADLNSTGCHFTWINGTVWIKIDRVMVNAHWFTLQQMAHVHFGTQELSQTILQLLSSWDYGNSMANRILNSSTCGLLILSSWKSSFSIGIWISIGRICIFSIKSSSN